MQKDIEAKLPCPIDYSAQLLAPLLPPSRIICAFACVFCVRVEEEGLRKPLVFVFTLLLFSIPLLYDVKSTAKYSNLIKIMKNLLYAVLLTGIVYTLIELLVSTFYLLF